MTDCKVVAGLPFMNDEVIEAVQTWRYTPATFNGKVVAVPLLVPLRFRTIAAEPEK